MSHISATGLNSSIPNAINSAHGHQHSWALRPEEIQAALQKKRPEGVGSIANNLMPGIENLGGNDCWAISLLQMLATVPSLEIEINKLHRLFQLSNQDNQAQATQQLLEVVNQVKQERQRGGNFSSVSSYQLRLILREIVGSGLISVNPNDQHDASEVFSSLLNKVSELYTNISSCASEDLAPALQCSLNSTSGYKLVGDQQDYRMIGGQRVNSENLYAHSMQFPNASDSLRICYEDSFDVPRDENSLSLHAIQIGQFKQELRELYFTKERIRVANMPEEGKMALIKQNDELVFQQVLLSVFRDIEEDGALMGVIDGRTRKFTHMQKQGETKTFTQAPQELMINLNKREYDDRGSLVKVCHMVERHGIYGSYNAPIEADVPLFEKFTLPAVVASEDATYEANSFLIHRGGEGGGGGHYTSCQKIEGQWFLCNDSITHSINQEQLEEYIQQASLVFYSKTAHVDQNALRLSVPESRQALLDQRRQVMNQLSAPIDRVQRQGLGSNPVSSKAGASKGSPEINQQLLRAELELLEGLRATISNVNGGELATHLLTLPEDIQKIIFDALSEKVRASEEFSGNALKNPIDEGRKILDKDFSQLVSVHHKNSGFGDLVTKNNFERSSLDALVAQLFNEPVDMNAVHEIFYHKNFKSVRDQIRGEVFLSSVSDAVRVSAEQQLPTLLPEVLNAIILEKRAKIPAESKKSITPPPSTPRIQSASESKGDPHKKLKESLEARGAVFGGSYGKLRGELLSVRARVEEVQKPNTLESDLNELATALREGKYDAFSRMLDSKSSSVRDQVHNRLCNKLLETRQRYKSKLSDPVKAGTEMLKNLSNLKLLLKAEDSLPRVLGISYSISVIGKEKEDFDDLMALLHEDETKSLNNSLHNKLYMSHISKETRDQVRRFVCLTQVAEGVEQLATELLYNLDSLSPNERDRQTLIDALTTPVAKK